MTPEVFHSQNLVSDTLQLIEKSAEQAIAERGEFRLSLSGGNTPRPIYEAMATRPFDWDKIVMTFGDERCVPPEDERSNYHMARLALFDRIPIPKTHILRMRGEDDPVLAADLYEEELRQRSPDTIFIHDLILLGMGPDGHTASLFPNTPALKENDRWIVSNFVPQMDMWRLTFTYPLINAARHVCFVLSKKGKEAVLDQILTGSNDYPSSHIKPSAGKVTWMIGD